MKIDNSLQNEDGEDLEWYNKDEFKMACTYREAYKEGYDEGYKEGYKEGYEEGKKEFSNFMGRGIAMLKNGLSFDQIRVGLGSCDTADAVIETLKLFKTL